VRGREAADRQRVPPRFARETKVSRKREEHIPRRPEDGSGYVETTSRSRQQGRGYAKSITCEVGRCSHVVYSFCRKVRIILDFPGGKGSQALLGAVLDEHQPQAAAGGRARCSPSCPIWGRAEWPQTGKHCQQLADAAGVELVTVRRAKGDLVASWQERMETLRGTAKPFWSSAANRYCTSDLKRDPINRYLRRYPLVVSAVGIRAAESRARAMQPLFGVNRRITSSKPQGGRRAFVWNSLLGWGLPDVWRACGTDQQELDRRRQLYRQGMAEEAVAGWPAHPAYVYGNERLSCALCVLASKNDIRNGARHNPELYQVHRVFGGCSCRGRFAALRSR
jgi:3'-phosphoadenosine 5'-phosphosulfate sulfotransferase (PAPS reductase)/FAD synthetase